MNPLRLIQSVAAAILTALAIQAAGQNTLEIIALRHRTADQVMPALRGLVEPGGTLSGQGNQIFVRVSPDNLANIRQALDAIDRPLRRLQISVRFDDAMDAASQGIEANGRISNRSARVEVRAHDARMRSTERVDQRVQVVEGGRAFISTGQSIPVLQGTVIRDAATGFETVPRLAGDQVLLDIAPRRESLDQQQHVATTVSARLGEWLEVGGAVESASRDDRVIL